MDEQGRRRLARLTAAAASHTQVTADARNSRDLAWWEAYHEAGALMPEIAEASGAPLATVHRGITREQARRDREDQ